MQPINSLITAASNDPLSISFNRISLDLPNRSNRSSAGQYGQVLSNSKGSRIPQNFNQNRSNTKPPPLNNVDSDRNVPSINQNRSRSSVQLNNSNSSNSNTTSHLSVGVAGPWRSNAPSANVRSLSNYGESNVANEEVVAVHLLGRNPMSFWTIKFDGGRRYNFICGRIYFSSRINGRS